MSTATQDTVTVRVGDMVGQREIEADIQRDASWGEALNAILGRLSLPRNIDGEDQVWTGRLDREGRQLYTNEIVGDALQTGDKVVIQRDIQAGLGKH